MGARPKACMAGFSGREGLLVIDNESPPGAWRDELARAPWAYGQKPRTVEGALSEIRRVGMWEEATLLSQEISLLKAEIYQLRARKDTGPARLDDA
jgi:hypothetical protein